MKVSHNLCELRNSIYLNFSFKKEKRKEYIYIYAFTLFTWRLKETYGMWDQLLKPSQICSYFWQRDFRLREKDVVINVTKKQGTKLDCLMYFTVNYIISFIFFSGNKHDFLYKIIILHKCKKREQFHCLENRIGKQKSTSDPQSVNKKMVLELNRSKIFFLFLLF